MTDKLFMGRTTLFIFPYKAHCGKIIIIRRPMRDKKQILTNQKKHWEA